MLHPVFVIRKLWGVVDNIKLKGNYLMQTGRNVMCLPQTRQKQRAPGFKDLSLLNYFSIVVTYLRVILFILPGMQLYKSLLWVPATQVKDFNNDGCQKFEQLVIETHLCSCSII
jgi:hypothetical protein